MNAAAKLGFSRSDIATAAPDHLRSSSTDAGDAGVLSKAAL